MLSIQRFFSLLMCHTQTEAAQAKGAMTLVTLWYRCLLITTTTITTIHTNEWNTRNPQTLSRVTITTPIYIYKTHLIGGYSNTVCMNRNLRCAETYIQLIVKCSFGNVFDKYRYTSPIFKRTKNKKKHSENPFKQLLLSSRKKWFTFTFSLLMKRMCFM